MKVSANVARAMLWILHLFLVYFVHNIIKDSRQSDTSPSPIIFLNILEMYVLLFCVYLLFIYRERESEFKGVQEIFCRIN